MARLLRPVHVGVWIIDPPPVVILLRAGTAHVYERSDKLTVDLIGYRM